MSESERPLLIVVSGLSGSGKSVALNALEDLDFFCTDNLPAELLPRFVRSVASDSRGRRRLAVGIDARSRLPDLSRIPDWLAEVAALGFDPVSLEALLARTGLATAQLQAQLMALELQGQVARLPGGLYQRMASA